jgi:hypothetical protein
MRNNHDDSDSTTQTWEFLFFLNQSYFMIWVLFHDLGMSSYVQFSYFMISI